VHPLAESVLRFVRRESLVRAGDRVGVAVSGGPDSVVLLRLLVEARNELGIALVVLHLNHRLRGAEADADAAFVCELAQHHTLPFQSESGETQTFARAQGLSLEAAGRELRYAFFARAAAAHNLTRIATGHTADDQAETVLLRLFRGAGTRGLAGIHLTRGLENSAAKVVRPLLATRRAEIERYLRDIGQAFRIDASNADPAHARNRVRHSLVPLLESEFNPAIVRVLGETAEVARAEEEFWREYIRKVSPVQKKTAHAPSLPISSLLAQPLSVQRRLVRALADAAGLALDFHHVETTLAALNAKHPPKPTEGLGGAPTSQIAHKLASLAHGWQAVMRNDVLCLEPPHGQAAPREPYSYSLPVPGETAVPQLQRRFRAILLSGSARNRGYNREQLLDASRVGSSLVVRCWRPGDRFWPQHRRAPHKVKELLQERHVGGAERPLWPVVESAGRIVWMRGFAAAADVQAPEGGDAVAIDELPLG